MNGRTGVAARSAWGRGRLALLLMVVVPLVGTGLAALTVQEPPFPHERHEGLFPLCVGCHGGVPRGDAASTFPDPETCLRCHDGETEVRISWSPPEPEVDNLRFQHVEHASRLAREGEPEQGCRSCHVPSGGSRMQVSTDIQLPTCFGCHEHQAQEHFVDANCSTCHVPLAESRFDLPRIESLPVPADHEPGSFLGEGHGSMAQSGVDRCATCHTADRCVTCHVDADRPEIAALSFAPAGMELPPSVAHYNEPISHTDPGWFQEHGGQASRRACATCHTSDDCAACHIQPAPGAVEALPSRDEVQAPGVGLMPRAPDSHDSHFFLESHTGLAAADGASCATCHQETFCTDCHDGPSDGGYHPPNFVARHPSEAWGRDTECATCHNSQVFCRSCHVESGLSSAGRLGPGYHAPQSFWLLRHGQAARQNLESCTTCHTQANCIQCHGVLGSFKISPHSRDFDAERAYQRSPRTCAACHVGNPLNRSDP